MRLRDLAGELRRSLHLQAAWSCELQPRSWGLGFRKFRSLGF